MPEEEIIFEQSSVLKGSDHGRLYKKLAQYDPSKLTGMYLFCAEQLIIARLSLQSR
jgi:hypothetical protein